MKAIEFKSKLGNKSFHIPKRFQAELNNVANKNVRVIIYLEDSDIDDEQTLNQATREQFLKGYSDSDSIYDN